MFPKVSDGKPRNFLLRSHSVAKLWPRLATNARSKSFLFTIWAIFYYLLQPKLKSQSSYFLDIGRTLSSLQDVFIMLRVYYSFSHTGSPKMVLSEKKIKNQAYLNAHSLKMNRYMVLIFCSLKDLHFLNRLQTNERDWSS